MIKYIINKPENICIVNKKKVLRLMISISEEILLPALLDEYKTLRKLVETNWSNFIRHRDRLRMVRENKKNNPVDLYEGSFANKDSDLYSDAGSTLASSSRGSR